MPMPGLTNLHDIGVVARSGRNRRDELVSAGRVREDEQLVLIAMGGIDHRLPLERWPSHPDRRYIVPGSWEVSRDDCSTIESCAMDFSDLLASSDAVITKPGYGTFAEAAISARPVLYVRRSDWPEEPCLVEWLQRRANCCEIARDALEAGLIEDSLQQLFAAPARSPVKPAGVEEVVSALVSRLGS